MKLTTQELIDNVVEDNAINTHSALMEHNNDEALDGDETELVAKLFLEELNKLNGNV